MTLLYAIIRYYFSYYFSYYDTWDYYFSYYFSYYDTWDYYFSIMTHYFSLFFPLFSIMTWGLHPKNGNVQSAIPDPLTQEWLFSVDEECPLNCIDWKARIQKGKQPDALFQDYYTHYFYYYAHYFSWLTSIAVTVSTSYALQIYEHGFSVLQWA